MNKKQYFRPLLIICATFIFVSTSSFSCDIYTVNDEDEEERRDEIEEYERIDEE